MDLYDNGSSYSLLSAAVAVMSAATEKAGSPAAAFVLSAWSLAVTVRVPVLLPILQC